MLLLWTCFANLSVWLFSLWFKVASMSSGITSTFQAGGRRRERAKGKRMILINLSHCKKAPSGVPPGLLFQKQFPWPLVSRRVFWELSDVAVYNADMNNAGSIKKEGEDGYWMGVGATHDLSIYLLTTQKSASSMQMASSNTSLMISSVQSLSRVRLFVTP